MVGALSIVRFRTPIKEPEELVYIFLCVATGLGLGASQFLATSIAVFVILFVIGVIKFRSFNNNISSMYLTIEADEALCKEGNPLDLISRILAPHCLQVKLKRAQVFTGRMYISFSISIKDEMKCNLLINDLKETFPDSEITLIDTSQILFSK
jgi:hypothetical protein